MNIEEAIATGIEFEKKVHAAYESASRRANDPTAKRVFQTLAEEEKGHIAYLESRLTEWQRRGVLSDEKLGTILPSRERILARARRVRSHVARPNAASAGELESLRQALAAEDETSGFYRRMVQELPAEGQELFSRFLEIEEGHAALVQAEIDHVQSSGFWFDIREFDLEAG